MQTWEQPPLLIMHSFSPERRKEKRRPAVRKEMDAQTPPNQSRHTTCTSLDCRGKSEHLHRPHADRETKCKLQSSARQSNSQPTVLVTTKKTKKTCQLLLKRPELLTPTSFLWILVLKWTTKKAVVYMPGQ